MDSLTPQSPSGVASAVSGAARRVRAFKAADTFVVETYRLSTALGGAAGHDLARELRRAVVRCGGALVAAAVAQDDPPRERGFLESARAGLAEGRYYLYLARRFGLIDVSRYRALMSRQDAAARELDLALRYSRKPPDARSRDPS